ncbi:MAG: hypothetical protein LBR83_06025 [Clostridiales bacterium]|jgi:hypothetical protein|nr:hypothetical protein [Clostridiales bacterium]
MKSGRIFFILVIGFVFMYLMYGMMQFGDGSEGRNVESIARIIDKALVQCYALEGSYPTDIAHVADYGVIFDDDKYIYHYEYSGGNLKPTVMVLLK